MTTDPWVKAMLRKKNRDRLRAWRQRNPTYDRDWCREAYIPVKDRKPGDPQYRGTRRKKRRAA